MTRTKNATSAGTFGEGREGGAGSSIVPSFSVEQYDAQFITEKIESLLSGERYERAVARSSAKTTRQFRDAVLRWLDASGFSRCVMQMVRGFVSQGKHFGVRWIIETARYTTSHGRDTDEYKGCNDFAPVFGRLILIECPEAEGYFELKKSRFDAFFDGAEDGVMQPSLFDDTEVEVGADGSEGNRG